MLVDPVFHKGHDESADWTGPAQKLVDAEWEYGDIEDINPHMRSVLNHRLEGIFKDKEND